MGDNRESLSEVLRAYIKLTSMNETQFAREMGIAPGEFSRRKNGRKKFDIANARRVLEILAEYKAITNKTQARNLLDLMKIADLPPGDWNSEPLKSLKDTGHDQPDTLKAQPMPAVPHTPVVAQSDGGVDVASSPQTLPAPPRRLKGIIIRHKWVIVLPLILVVALVAGSFFIEWFPLWGLFHKAPTLPSVPWGPTRSITCGDLFNPVNPAEQIPTTPTNTNIATCAPTSDGHVTLSLRKLQEGDPELDVKDGHGPSGSNYRVALRMNLSPTASVPPQIAGCVLVDTSPKEAIGEVVCVHSNGVIEVLDAKTMINGVNARPLDDVDRGVTINDPANVPVIVERVDNKLYIEVADQGVQPIDLTTPTGSIPAGNIGFLADGTQGSLQMSAIELA